MNQQQIDEIGRKVGITPVGNPQTSAAQSVAQRRQLAAEYDAKQKAQAPKQSRLQETGQDIKQTFGDIKNTISGTKDKIQNIANAEVAGEQGKLRSFGQAVGTVAGGFSKVFGDVVKGVLKVSGSTEEEQSLKQVSEKVAADVTQAVIAKHEKMKVEEPEKAAAVESLINNFKNLDPKTKRDVGALMGITQFATDLATFGGTKKIAEIGAEQAGNAAKNAAVKTGEAVVGSIDNAVEQTGKLAQDTFNTVKQSGVGQKFTELAERVPRAVKRAGESIEESAAKAEKIRLSPPAVQKAYKANLDEKIINTVQQADEPTKQAYRQMVGYAKETGDTLKMKKKPSIVAGEAAAKQYNLIEKQRKTIGEGLNEATKKLSKEKTILMENSFKEVDDVLGNQGISIRYTKKGPKLDFTEAGFTPVQRARIQELYSLAVEGGNKLSPSQIHLKDKMFSQLQREARMDPLVGDIRIETSEGSKSLFSVFRDIYSKQLDEVSPEIKELNSQYRKVRTLLDDIEDSIVKGGNFEATKSANPAVFAQTNLRRILSDAQSAGAYSEIVKKMDAAARKLGYTGAKAEDLILFAEELRKIFPDTIPKTSFQGGIKTSIGDVFNKVLEAGAPNTKDQQKALEELLESFNTGAVPKTAKGFVAEQEMLRKSKQLGKPVLDLTDSGEVVKLPQMTDEQRALLFDEVKTIAFKKKRIHVSQERVLNTESGKKLKQINLKQAVEKYPEVKKLIEKLGITV